MINHLETNNFVKPTMHATNFSIRLFVLLILVFVSTVAQAQVPVHAQGLKEELLVVDLGANLKQAGVLSVKIGTSMGTISSSFMPVYAPTAYTGAIHTAAITEPLARNSYRELSGFDYRQSKVPQFFVHHKNDPCHLTTWLGAKSLSDKFGATLITVNGGSGFQGGACEAFTEHGFRGKEKEVMAAIAVIIKTGQPAALSID